MRKLLLLPLLLLIANSAFAFEQINIQFTQQPGTPYFVGQPEINIDAEEFTTVVLKIKSATSGTARLFWATNFDPKMNEPKSIWFFLDRSADGKEYVFNLHRQNQAWAGFAGQLLIMPENGPAGIEIVSAKAVPGNLLSDVRSGWREFWGPKGRLIEGPTVNNMRALMLWGQPVNFYIYGLVLLAALATFGRTRSWRYCGQVTIITALGFWGVLTVSQLVSEYDQFRVDLARYGFKPLEEKRAAAVAEFGQDFYPFLMFCRANVPERAGVKFISADTSDYAKGRAIYFLYPLDFYATKPEYVLSYNYGQGLAGALADNPGFHLYKKYNEGAFILWRK
jgi:hypothetical protein